ncbi:MAG TPA: protein kinase [Thermoanaerobaculia bacterium]|jgi:serine/threonine-protein kinase|nr:protein kinase [Thermoanaerobaculia bacterium]
MTEPNDRIGAYRLVRRLGSGGMGEVFLAWDGRLERTVAAKRMRPDRDRGGARRERFRREARAAARLNHPNVVQIFDLVESGDEAGDWIVMEYVQGRSLADLLRNGPLPPGAAVDLARQVAEGLAAAHAQGLVHRDLKAENVMVTSAGQAKILDFGLARPLESGTGETLTGDGMVMGTWRSMSPEQAAGDTADARSDLFSLGVLLYETLAGRSPFLGKTPIETLRNVTGAPPEPLDGLRPELPPELIALVASLLEKDPGRRPATAEQVARDLRALAARPELSPPSGWALPAAGSATAEGEMPTVIEGPIGMRGSFIDSRRWTRPRRLAWIAAFAVAALAVLLGVIGTRHSRKAAGPLRVAVPPPARLGNGGEAIDFAAFGIQNIVLRTLSSLDGVTAIDPSQFREVQGGNREIARAISAGEVLATTLEGKGKKAEISLRRIRGSDEEILWQGRVEESLDPRDALMLARDVSAVLREAFEGRVPRKGSPGLEVRAADYAEFLRIKRRVEAGRGAWAPELERLNAILSGSPRFLDAYIQAASLAIYLYEDSKNPAYLERARSSLRRARLLAPELPDVLSIEIRLAVTEGDWVSAEQLIAELERLVPGDPRPLVQRASLAYQRGRLDEAVSWMRQVVQRVPTWRNLVTLSGWEARTGQLAEARRHLAGALLLAPGNTWVLAKMGEVELAYGDLSRAEKIYRGLVNASPQRSDLTNLGLIHFLLGRYEDAAADYRRALQIDPGHITVTLDLADAELALGHRREAAELHRQILAALEAKERGAALLPIEQTFRAQCLAYLGESRKAVDIALGALQGSPEDADVVYQSALVLAVSGERASALSLVRKALSLGYQPRWFGVPAFDSLRSDPAFREMLAARRS